MACDRTFKVLISWTSFDRIVRIVHPCTRECVWGTKSKNRICDSVSMKAVTPIPSSSIKTFRRGGEKRGKLRSDPLVWHVNAASAGFEGIIWVPRNSECGGKLISLCHAGCSGNKDEIWIWTRNRFCFAKCIHIIDAKEELQTPT